MSGVFLILSHLLVSNGFDQFIQDEKSYEISFPEAWIKHENYDQADILVREPAQKRFPVNCNMISKNGTKALDPQAYYNKSFEEVKAVPGFAEIQRGFLPMSKEKVAWIAFERQIYTDRYVTHSYLFAEGTHSFVLTCIAAEDDYQAYKDLFHKIAGSFDFANVKHEVADAVQ